MQLRYRIMSWECLPQKLDGPGEFMDLEWELERLEGYARQGPEHLNRYGGASAMFALVDAREGVQSERRRNLGEFALYLGWENTAADSLRRYRHVDLAKLRDLKRRIDALLVHLRPLAVAEARKHEAAARKLRKALRSVTPTPVGTPASPQSTD